MHTLGERPGFSWDPEKARKNLHKHGVEFADAIAVFQDDLAVTVRDIITAVDEQRYLATGRDALLRETTMKKRNEPDDYEIPDEIDFSKGRRGAIVPTPPWKTRITIRIDTEILDWFRKQVNEAGGGNYQTLMNNALREHITRREGTLAETLRQVLREELARKKRRQK